MPEETMHTETSTDWQVNNENPAETASIFVVIPTYNEAQNLPLLTSDLFSLPIHDMNIVVVDDNSPDGTGDISEKLGDEFNGKVHTLHRPGKQGLGKAYLQGFRYALEHGADYIIQMDADVSHSPSYIMEFLKFMSQYDIVIGSRYAKGGKLDPRWSIWRYWLSLWANSIYVRMILGLPIRDATGGFKCWSRRALEAVMQYPISSSGFIFQVETNLIAVNLGFKVYEIPIFFGERRAGASKMNSNIKVEAALKTWELRWKYRNMKRQSAH